jgi:hypothetical protein
MRFVIALICAAVGLGAAKVYADIGISPCPGGPYPTCPLGFWAPVGDPVWLCCTDLTHMRCVNWWRQKYVCNWSDPGDPTTYGYTTYSHTDTLNLNCDTDHVNECF